MKLLHSLKIAVLVSNGFEQSELVEPRKALENAGAEVVLISPEESHVKGWKDGNWADSFPIDLALSKARAEEYHALLLPGGQMNPDKLRIIPEAIEFIQKFVKSNKPIAAICHGPWPLINAQGVKGKTMTAWPSLELDLKNAGAQWVDKEVVVDGNLVTSRKPDDIPAFNKAFIELLSKIA
jgi:protease I